MFEGIDSIKDCKEKCLNSQFRCHSFDFSDNICRISHLDKNSLTHIENPYIKVVGTTTYELLMCYNGIDYFYEILSITSNGNIIVL